MTFTDIQTEVADRLNLTSSAALARIGRSINERYKWLASAIGFSTIETQTISANTVIGNQTIVFTCEKILTVFNPAFTPVQVLAEALFTELRDEIPGTDPPQRYAIKLAGASTVTLFLDCIPATIYALSADALVNLATLSGTQIPAFPEDYHNILVYGAMATELEKMEKYDLAARQENRFETRVSDLRYYQMKSAWLDIYQGKSGLNDIASAPLI